MNNIIRLNKENKTLWGTYIEKKQETRIQHSLKFMEVIKEAYKNCKEYYFFYQNGEVVAIFPFFLVKSWIFGNRLICVPFLDVGGFSGDYNSKILITLSLI